ncbi:MAG: PmoA family protein [FCB group bacterium]|jgi:hypothetical protein|nr:PmoA family protein [FCB group bacterium]
MRKVIMSFALAALLATAAGAQGLDGKTFTVRGGAADSLNAPISIAYDGADPETSVEVVPAGGAPIAATVRAGELVFVPEAVPAGSETVYTVKVLKEKKQPAVEVKQKGDEKVLEITVNGKPVTAYHYTIDDKVSFEAAKAAYPDLTEDEFKRLDSNGDGVWTAADEPLMQGEEKEKDAGVLARLCHRKPFLWPVLAEGQATVTRNWPMGESEGKMDHLHQKSLWTAHGKLNNASFWEESYERSGYEMVETVEFGSGDAYGWIVSHNVWQDREHKPVITETREYRFYATPDSTRTFDLAVAFKADYGDVIFGDTKEGGLIALRMRPSMNEQGGTGTITTANGQGEKTVWGKPSPWCDYSGTIEGVGTRGVTFFDHPSNLRHPARWHVRSYGLMGANYFGLKDFEPDLKQQGDWTLKSGEGQTFQYRTLIHSGNAAEAKIADRYTAYATPAQATWK